ncbi:uncharacterized protein TNCV_3442671 [Trichonephila clavipes]|nr:uncharacterized protein TNCV_3442671 [Trichonephila clavipes]
MRQGIWTIYLHKISTEENPQHGFCPPGPVTWCRYKKAQLENKIYHHKHKLPVSIVEAIGSIFRNLSDPELLKKCLHGNTQNPNESINNVIWSRVPKKTFVHLETLSFGTYDAIASFNKMNATKLDILKKLNIEPGYWETCGMECLDKERITRARYANLQKTKEVRIIKRLKKLYKRVNFQKMLKIWNMELECFDKIVRVQYFVRGGTVGYRSRVSSKHLSSHLPVDGVRFLGGQKGVALQLQDSRAGVGPNKDADRC